MKVTVLDVGQADGMLIEMKDGTTVLVDSDQSDITDALENHGIDNLDYVVNTHPHKDHIFGESEIINEYDLDAVFSQPRSRDLGNEPNLSQDTLKDVLQRNKLSDSQIKELRNSDSFRDCHVDAIEVRQQQGVESYPVSTYEENGIIRSQLLELSKEADIEILAPPPRDARRAHGIEGADANSVVMRIDDGSHSHLITGDMDANTEEYLMEHFEDEIDVDVYHASHHGSTRNGENSQDFLERVDPDVTVISSGNHAGRKHPHSGESKHPNVFDRIDSVNSDSYCTQPHGSITFNSAGRGYEVVPQRNYPNSPQDVENYRDYKTFDLGNGQEKNLPSPVKNENRIAHETYETKEGFNRELVGIEEDMQNPSQGFDNSM